MKQDCKIADGVLCDVIRGLYQGAFFFLNVRFHGAPVNVIYTFTPMVFRADCNETHQCSKVICSDLSYDFHQKGTTVKKRDRNLFTPLNQVWLRLRQFLRNLQSLKVLWASPVSFFFFKIREKNVENRSKEFLFTL